MPTPGADAPKPETQLTGATTSRLKKKPKAASNAWDKPAKPDWSGKPKGDKPAFAGKPKGKPEDRRSRRSEEEDLQAKG